MRDEAVPAARGELGSSLRERLVILLPSACFLLLYLLTLTDVHTYDALSYILDVDRKPWRELFHPHHLAYGPFGALIRWGAAGLGWPGSAERLLQAANALAGALGVALLGALAQRAAGARAGVTAALLLGASYAYWYYAVEVEVYTIAAVLLVVCLGLLLALARDPRPGLAAALGVAQGLAVLFHQTNVLLGAPALVAIALAARRSGDERPTTKDEGQASATPQGARRSFRPSSIGLRLLLAYGLPLALIVGGAYLGVGLGVSGLRSWGELAGWMAGYATTGLWGGPPGVARLGLLGAGLAESLMQPGGAVVGLVLLGTLLAHWRGLRAGPAGAAPICLSWLLAYGAFFFWWEPDNIEFWIASMPPFYLLAVLAVYGPAQLARSSPPAPDDRPPTTDGRRKPGPGSRLARPGRWILPACGLLMLAVNGLAIGARGDGARDLQRAVAQELAAGSAAGDLLVAPDGVVELYLPFYEGRENVTSLSQALTAAGGDWAAACARLRGRIDAALAGGYAVRIGAEALRPAPAPPGEPPTPAERAGLSPDAVAACYEPYGPALLPAGAGAPQLPGYYRIPGAQELADGAGWDFARSRWGWRAANAEAAASALPGWALRPGVDPALTSPPLRLEAARYAAVELRLAATTTARDAQLFFVDEAGQVDEGRSLRWALAAGDGPHSYRLALRGAPGWEGVVTGLRLDPVSAGDGGVVVVESIRLLAANGTTNEGRECANGTTNEGHECTNGATNEGHE